MTIDKTASREALVDATMNALYSSSELLAKLAQGDPKVFEHIRTRLLGMGEHGKVMYSLVADMVEFEELGRPTDYPI